MKTFSVKPSDITRAWYVLDASEAPLGQVATKAATLLTGKDKPMFSHHIDCGDFVVIINAEKVVATGKKLADKKYYRHSGFPGGIKERSLTEQLEKAPTEVVVKATRGMLPVNKLRPGRLQRLKVYAGAEHGHEAQKPVTLTLKEKK